MRNVIELMKYCCFLIFLKSGTRTLNKRMSFVVMLMLLNKITHLNDLTFCLSAGRFVIVLLVKFHSVIFRFYVFFLYLLLLSIWFPLCFLFDIVVFVALWQLIFLFLCLLVVFFSFVYVLFLLSDCFCSDERGPARFYRK